MRAYYDIEYCHDRFNLRQFLGEIDIYVPIRSSGHCQRRDRYGFIDRAVGPAPTEALRDLARCGHEDTAMLSLGGGRIWRQYAPRRRNFGEAARPSRRFPGSP